MPESGVAAAAVTPAAETMSMVEEELVARGGKNGGKGRKQPSLAMSRRGRRQLKRAREPTVVEVIIKLLIKLEPLLHGTNMLGGDLTARPEDPAIKHENSS